MLEAIAHGVAFRRAIKVVLLGGVLVGIAAGVHAAGNRRSFFWDNNLQEWLVGVAGACFCYAAATVFIPLYTAFLTIVSRLGAPTVSFYGAAVTPYLPHFGWVLAMWVLYGETPVDMVHHPRVDELFLWTLIAVLLFTIRAVTVRYLLRQRVKEQLSQLSRKTASFKIMLYMLSRAVSSDSVVLESNKLLAGGGDGKVPLSALTDLPPHIEEMCNVMADKGADGVAGLTMASIRRTGFLIDADLGQQLFSSTNIKWFPRLFARKKPQFMRRQRGFEVSSGKQMAAVAAVLFDKLKAGVGVQSAAAAYLSRPLGSVGGGDGGGGGGGGSVAGSDTRAAAATVGQTPPTDAGVGNCAGQRAGGGADDLLSPLPAPHPGAPATSSKPPRHATSGVLRVTVDRPPPGPRGTVAPAPVPTASARATTLHSFASRSSVLTPMTESLAGAMARTSAIGGATGAAAASVHAGLHAMLRHQASLRSGTTGSGPSTPVLAVAEEANTSTPTSGAGAGAGAGGAGTGASGGVGAVRSPVQPRGGSGGGGNTVSVPIRMLTTAADEEALSADTYIHVTDLKLLAGPYSDAALELLDPNKDLRVTKEEFVMGVKKGVELWKALNLAWTGHSTVSRALSISSSTVLSFALLVALLVVFRLSVTDVLLPIATIGVAVSFAIGGAISEVVRSLFFLVGRSSFEIGDRVSIQGVQRENTMYVVAIDLLSTTFRLISGKLIEVSNARLADMVISNHRRSTSVTFEVAFTVSVKTPASRLLQLKQCAELYVRARPRRWRAEVDLIVNKGSPGPDAVVEYGLWVTHLATWQDGGIIWGDRGRFLHAMCGVMDTLGIEYVRPLQPISGSMTVKQPVENEIRGLAGSVAGDRRYSDSVGGE